MNTQTGGTKWLCVACSSINSAEDEYCEVCETVRVTYQADKETTFPLSSHSSPAASPMSAAIQRSASQNFEKASPTKVGSLPDSAKSFDHWNPFLEESDSPKPHSVVDDSVMASSTDDWNPFAEPSAEEQWNFPSQVETHRQATPMEKWFSSRIGTANTKALRVMPSDFKRSTNSATTTSTQRNKGTQEDDDGERGFDDGGEKELQKVIEEEESPPVHNFPFLGFDTILDPHLNPIQNEEHEQDPPHPDHYHQHHHQQNDQEEFSSPLASPSSASTTGEPLRAPNERRGSRSEKGKKESRWARLSALGGKAGHLWENRKGTIEFVSETRDSKKRSGSTDEFPAMADFVVERPRVDRATSSPKTSVSTPRQDSAELFDINYWKPHTPKVIKVQSFVRKWICKRAYYHHRYRSRVVREILSSEESYIGSLQYLSRALHSLLAQEKPILKIEQIKAIFNECDSILLYAEEFRDKLLFVVKDWHVEKVLGPLFIEMEPFLKVYIRYITQYTNCITTYKECLQKNKQFKVFVEDILTINNVDLGAIFIMPVQRIPRYVLLLNDLIKHTSPTHPDYHNLLASCMLVKSFVETANNTKREYDNYQAILRVNQLLLPHLKNLIQPHRRFKGAGELLLLDDRKLMKRNKQKVRYVFLFTDMLLVTKYHPLENRYRLKTLVRMSLTIHLDHFPKTNAPRAESAFRLYTEKPPKSLVFLARNIEEKMSWIISLEKVVEEIRRVTESRPLQNK